MSLDEFSRVELLFGRSPVHRLRRLSEYLGDQVEIWAKREDCNSGLAYGGNKVRKLEYLAADALAQARIAEPDGFLSFTAAGSKPRGQALLTLLVREPHGLNKRLAAAEEELATRFRRGHR